jgi:hypothetical protein
VSAALSTSVPAGTEESRVVFSLVVSASSCAMGASLTAETETLTVPLALLASARPLLVPLSRTV